MKTATVLFLLITGLARPAAAAGELHNVFAGCVGRYSAEMEHAWLIGDATADEFQDLRQTFIALMEATMPPGSGRAILLHRLDHKFAHAALLSVATFGEDARRARAARVAARGFRVACERLLLGG